MGPGFVILFWLLIAAIFGAFWLAALVIFIVGRRKKSQLMTWLGGRKSFAWETTLMTYDSTTGIVQYFYIGID